MNRKPTGIPGLDVMLGGGLLPETAVLLDGAPGTGKTTFGLQFIYNGITVHDEPGIVLTFEEFPRQYYHDAAGFGWDLPRLEAADKLRVIMTSPEVVLTDLKQPDGMLAQTIQAIGAQRVLVDSLSHFARLEPDPIALREKVYAFVNGLKRLGLTTVLTWERSALLGGDPNLGEPVSFVVDGCILLRYVELDSVMRKALLVLKLRGSDHARDIRQYEITGEGLVVDTCFEGRQGIMSGYAIPNMADAFNTAFGRPSD